jgi:plastocyanin domain-containing protein
MILTSVAFAEEAYKAKKIYKATIDSSGVQKVEIIGGEYFFEPDYIIVKVNVPVELTFKKMPGIVPHDIVVKSPEAGIEFSEGMKTEPKSVKFTPKKVGKYPMYCTKKMIFSKSHREKGMEGMIEVVE